MAHDVFISYASGDKLIADAVCAALEADHIRCWIAPRDVLPGQRYAQAIVDAIHSARTFVLIFSAASNGSVQVEREVDRAVSAGLPILPLRVEDVMPCDSLEYYLAGQHWLDAMTPPLEAHLSLLSQAISVLLQPPAKTSPPPREPAQGVGASPGRAIPPEPADRATAGRRVGKRTLLMIGAFVLATTTVALVLLHPWHAGGPAGGGHAVHLTATVEPSAVYYDGSVTIWGSLTDGSGSHLPGSHSLVVESSTDGSSWSPVRTLTSSIGRYETSAQVQRTVLLRLSFTGDHAWRAATSATCRVVAKALVGAPDVPAGMRPGAWYTAYGYLWPRHPAGPTLVTVSFEHFESGQWRQMLSTAVSSSRDSGDATRWETRFKLTVPGQWRATATHVDADHVASSSASTYFKL